MNELKNENKQEFESIQKAQNIVMFGIWEFLLVLMGIDVVAIVIMVPCLIRLEKREKAKREEQDKERLKEEADEIVEGYYIANKAKIECNKPPTEHTNDANVNIVQTKDTFDVEEEKPDEKNISKDEALHATLRYAALKSLHQSSGHSDKRNNDNQSNDGVTPDDVMVETKDPRNEHLLFPYRQSPYNSRSTISSPISIDDHSDGSLTPVSTPRLMRNTKVSSSAVVVKNNRKLLVDPETYSPQSIRNRNQITAF